MLIEEKSIETLILLLLTWMVPISNYRIHFCWITADSTLSGDYNRALAIVLIEDTWNKRKLDHYRFCDNESCVNRGPKLPIPFWTYAFSRLVRWYIVCFKLYRRGILIIFAVIEFLNSASARWYATIVSNRFSPRCQVVSSVYRERIINCYLSVLINCCSRLSLPLICEISTWGTECTLSSTDFDNIL